MTFMTDDELQQLLEVLTDEDEWCVCDETGWGREDTEADWVSVHL